MLKLVRSSYFSRAALTAAVALLGLIGATARLGAQSPAARLTTFLVFFRGAPVGNEQIAVEKSAGGWSIGGSGRVGAPFDLVVRSLQARYDTDWKPVELTLDATLRGQAATIHTVVNGTTALTETTPFGASPIARSDQIDARAVLLPNTSSPPTRRSPLE